MSGVNLDNRAQAGPTRRGVLRGIAGSAAAAGLSGIASPAIARIAGGPLDVLVLGAGVSGLTAALALLGEGHNVTIIEYQDRVGGRLLSLPLGDGMVSEAGGGHFRSNMPYVLNYIRHYGLPLLSLNDGLPRYTVDGMVGDAANLADWPWSLAPDERNVTISSTLNRYLFRAGLDADTVLDARWPSPAMVDYLSNISLEDLIRSVGASDMFVKLLSAHSGAFYAVDAALAIIPTIAYHLGDQNLFRIKGGNDRLPLAMARSIGLERIVLGEPVVAIDQSGPRVKVTTQSGREFAGDRVVSTIPTPVLRDIAVTPQWSPAKQLLIDDSEWGNTVKVVVKTRTPKWLGEGVHGWPMAGGDRPWERAIDITGNEPGGYGNVFFYINGGNARSYLERPADTRARQIVAEFEQDLPGLFDEVLLAEEFAWSEQPWIRGSFGAIGPGQGWMVGEWRKPEGRIHFAGDFTTLKSGWVEGAIEAGLRAARQIDAEARPLRVLDIRQEGLAR